MSAEILIVWLVIGSIAGWLAGQIVAGGGLGLIGDILVGIVGSVMGGWILPRIGIYIGGGIAPKMLAKMQSFLSVPIGLRMPTA